MRLIKSRKEKTIDSIVYDLRKHIQLNRIATEVENSAKQFNAIHFLHCFYLLGYNSEKSNNILKSLDFSEIDATASYVSKDSFVIGRKIMNVLDERAQDVNINGWSLPKDFYKMLRENSQSTTFAKKTEIINLAESGGGVDEFCTVYDLQFVGVREKWKKDYSNWLKELKKNAAMINGLSNTTRAKLKEEPPKTLKIYIQLAYIFGWDVNALNAVLLKYSKFAKLNDSDKEHLVFRGVIDSVKHEEELVHKKDGMVKDIYSFSDRLNFYEELYSQYSEYLENQTNRSESGPQETFELIYQDYLNKRKINNGNLYEDKYFFKMMWDTYLKRDSGSDKVKSKIQDKLKRIGVTDIKNTGITEGVRKRFCDYYNHSGYLPTRKHVILCALFCALSYEEINELLILMNMNELYSRNPFEGALIYYLNHPAYSVNAESRFVVNNESDYDKLLNKAEEKNCAYKGLYGLFYQFCNDELSDFFETQEININDYI